jgi:hypothetical protein
MPDVLECFRLDNAVRNPKGRECIALGYSANRKLQAARVTARRIRSVIAAIGLAAGFVLVAGGPATSALASTPAPLTITTTSPLTATAGSSFLAKLDATGGTKPYACSLQLVDPRRMPGHRRGSSAVPPHDLHTLRGRSAQAHGSLIHIAAVVTGSSAVAWGLGSWTAPARQDISSPADGG